MSKKSKNNMTVTDKQKKFLELFKANAGLVATACSKFGITRACYYNWYKENPEFAVECDNIQEAQIDMAESSLLSKIKEKDLGATIFYLKTKGRNRGYIEKQYNETTIKKELQIKELNSETIELAEKLFKTL